MKRLYCADCACELELWDMVYDWPGVGEICENCMESRVYELSAREIAEGMGIAGRPTLQIK